MHLLKLNHISISKFSLLFFLKGREKWRFWKYNIIPAIENSAANATLTWPPMETRPSALKPPFPPSLCLFQLGRLSSLVFLQLCLNAFLCAFTSVFHGIHAWALVYVYIYIYIFTYVSLSIFLLRNLYNKLHGFNFTKRKKKPKLYFLISILHDEKKLSIPYNVAFIKERQRRCGYLLHCSVVVKASKFVEVLVYGVGWVRRNIKKIIKDC